MRSPNPIVTVDLSDKAYAMDCAEKLLVSREAFGNAGQQEDAETSGHRDGGS